MIRKIFLIHFLLAASLFSKETFTIGSKRFTESYILAEIIKQTAAETNEATIVVRPGLGNTGMAFAALQEEAIDLYPEYTGTIIHEILKLPANNKIDLDTINAYLFPFGIKAGVLFGFSNSYALAMDKENAQQLNISRISDLIRYPHLKMGFSQEFLKRNDGWEELKKVYQLPHEDVMGIDHSLGYKALANKQIDLMDIYTTDPKIEKYRLLILVDDLHFFPVYNALLLYRSDVPRKFPRIWAALQSISGSISNEKMLDLNAKAELSGTTFEDIAKNFLHSKEVSTSDSKKQNSFMDHLFGGNFLLLTKQHLILVFGSLIPAIIAGVPLGILATYSPLSRPIILSFAGVIQTIPSLAFFAFLIPLLHQVGMIPSLIVLFFYALLPIVRNTYTGLADIPKPIKESAIALGLPALSRLRLVEIPLALRTILAGIKTAAVINVGMATIAAFIGAGGYGERIITGLALNNSDILLSGAIPSCLLAILVQLSFDLMDYLIIPKGLK